MRTAASAPVTTRSICNPGVVGSCAVDGPSVGEPPAGRSSEAALDAPGALDTLPLAETGLSPPGLRGASVARVVPACAGDHPAVHQLLSAVFHAPSRDAFYSSLDDPFYEPRDRLLVKRGQRIVAHLHLTKRVMHFGPL